MRKVYSLLVVFLLVMSIQAQNELRRKVVVVRPVLYDSSVDFLLGFSDLLMKEGYKEAARFLKDYAKGGFGTGFVYADSVTGKKYVITNRHVVALAQSVTIEFRDNERNVSSYKDCPVAIVDEDIDLAAIALPDNVTVGSLRFADETPTEGRDVFTAGYPGLGDNPSWQFGKGIVSNAHFYDEELSKVGGNTILIQHTAQIDAGSSGSPLLIQSATDKNEYLVAGINTWKAYARENANFAIPTSDIRVFCEKYLSSAHIAKDDIRQRAETFVGLAEQDYKEMVPFIAYDYIASVAPSQFDSWYKTFPTNVRKDIMRQFRNNPIEGVRMALAYAVREKMRTKKISIEPVDNNSDGNTAETAEVAMKCNGKPATSKWIKEQGQWRLTELSFFRPKSYLSQSIIDKDYEYMNTLSFSYTHNLLNIGKPLVSMFGVSYNYMFNAFVVAEINFKKGKTFLPESGERYKMDIAGVSIGGQLPLALGKWRLVPYLGAYYKMAIGDVFRDYIGLSWGADLVYPLGQVAGVFVGVRYNTIPYIPGRFNLNQELYLGFAL
ncbi:MAG: serine protease [Bacteroidetes bacterium]|nr:MAG: serine protease [Bacteroidota bacterium]